MSSWHRIVLAGAVLLSATVSSGAHAQGYRIGNRIIPESSIERPGDIGHRVHTQLQILAGPDGEPAIGSDGGLGPGGGLTPAQLRQAYNLPSTGGSQIIALVDAYDDPNALDDFNTFSAQYGLPQELSASATASTNKVFQVLYGNNGVKPSADSTGGWELEESLDIEWAHAMAPNAKIILVEALGTSYVDLLAAEDAATNYTDGNGWKVKEVSNSWGGSEFFGENGYDSHFTSNGVAYFVAAGDEGAPAEYPSASPYVVSAGGTTVNTDNNGNFTSETVWSLSGGYGGGGGPSAYEARPAFQNGISGIVGSKRGTPDLSSAADPNTPASIYDTVPYNGFAYGWMYVGGTSWSSPTLAGIANLAAAAAGSFPAGTQALLTTVYSKLGTSNFRDITSGNNGYPAMVGWDFASGVGTCLGLAGLQASGPPLPTVTSLSPSSTSAGGPAFTLTVNGSGFVGGSTVKWSGSALTTTFVTSTQVTATVPASDIAAAGTASVTVSNPGGSTSGALTFTIIGVSITSLSPSSTSAGGPAFTLTVNGSGFVGGSTVKWSGSALTTTFVTSTQVTATVPASDIAAAGTASVTVSNPGGSTSSALTFTINGGGANPKPVLSSISPSSVTVNSASFTLTCTGSSFIPSSLVKVFYNGKVIVLATTYVSATSLTAVVPSTLLTKTGSISINVVNPAPGGGLSELRLTITP